MELQEALETLSSSEIFTTWKKSHTHCYLSHAFKMEQDQDTNWQLGYFDPKKQRVSTFIIDEPITLREDEEVFRKEGSEVKPIELDTVKKTYKEVIENARSLQLAEYNKHKCVKIISILQHLPTFGLVWNVTFLTESFNTLNMKVDPATGEIRDHKLTSVISFAQ